MRVTSFLGPNYTWAFTADKTGGNLPITNGLWQKHKNYNMHRGQKLTIDVDADWVIDAVTTGGYYLTTMSLLSKNIKSPVTRTVTGFSTQPTEFALQ